MINNFKFLKPLITILLFFLALSFENASNERSAILILVFTIYIAVGFIRNRYYNSKPWVFLLDILLILILEYHSKYLINYFFHSLYIVTIIEVVIFLKERKWANIIAAIIAVVGLGKFFYAAVYMINAKTIAELLFNIASKAFLITLINYGRLQSEEKDKNNYLYKELLNTYRKLKEYSLKIEEASVLEERTRIAGEIHDGLGHRLTALIMQMEIMGHLYSDGKDIAHMIEEAKEKSREALVETRRAIGALRDEQCNKIEDIERMIKSFSSSTLIKIKYRLVEVSLTPLEGVTLYRVVQEAITNAARHGRCSNITIMMKWDGEVLSFSIEDDGIGGNNKMGFGQRNMKDRLEAVGGSLSIIPGKPYRIKGTMPLSIYRENSVEGGVAI